MAYESGHEASRAYFAQDGTLVIPTGATLTIESGGTFSNAGSVALTGTQTFDDIAGNDTSLGITGLAVTAGTGGAVAIVGGATTTSGVGGLVSATGGAGSGTDAGGAASLVGGASGGGATGNGGNAAVTGGAAASTNGGGGSVILTGGAKAGTGIAGGVFLRSSTGQVWRQQVVSTAETDGANAVAAADMIGGICVHTVSQARTLTTPTGAALLAVCPAGIAAGDSFDFTVITVGTGSDDISTLTAGDGDITFVGPVTVGGTTGHGGTGDVGTWRFRYTGANAFVGYRIA